MGRGLSHHQGGIAATPTDTLELVEPIADVGIRTCQARTHRDKREGAGHVSLIVIEGRGELATVICPHARAVSGAAECPIPNVPNIPCSQGKNISSCADTPGEYLALFAETLNHDINFYFDSTMSCRAEVSEDGRAIDVKREWKAFTEQEIGIVSRILPKEWSVKANAENTSLRLIPPSKKAKVKWPRRTTPTVDSFGNARGRRPGRESMRVRAGLLNSKHLTGFGDGDGCPFDEDYF